MEQGPHSSELWFPIIDDPNWLRFRVGVVFCILSLSMSILSLVPGTWPPWLLRRKFPENGIVFVGQT